MDIRSDDGRRRFLGLLTVLLVATLLRVPHVARESLWLDEVFTHWVATQPFGDALATVQRDVTHPPLFYLLTRGSVGLLGADPVGLRMVSLLASIALAGVAFGLALALTRGHFWAAFTAGTLVAVSDLQVWHAISARSYAFWSLLIALAAWAFYLVVTEPTRRGPRVAYAVVAVLAVLTHFFGWLYLAALGPLALVARDRRRALRDWLVLSLPAAVATAIWLAFLPPVTRILNASVLDWIPAPTAYRVFRTGLILFGVPLMPSGTRFTLAAVVLWSVLVVVVLRRRSHPMPSILRETLWLIGCFMLVPAALILLAWVVTGNSYWVVRQLLPSQAFVALTVGMGLAVVANASRPLAGLVLAGLVVLNNPGRFYGPPLLLNDPYHLIADDIRQLRGASELTLATRPQAIWQLNYYLAGADTASSLRDGPHNPDPSVWIPHPYPPVPDSVLDRSPALLVVRGSREAPRYDSLLAAGWRVAWSRTYPLARRPELWSIDTIRLEKLIPPTIGAEAAAGMRARTVPEGR